MSSRKVTVEPAEYSIYPGSMWSFQLLIDGMPDPAATWSVLGEPCGVFRNPHSGEFTAFDRILASQSTIVGTSGDGKDKAQALVHILVPAPFGLGNKPALVDDFSLLGAVQSLRWNDPIGARAALLIYDVLNQLPKDFLDAVGDISIIRAKTLPGTRKDFTIVGQHWPLLDNPVMLAEDHLISRLTLEPSITDADRFFAETFIHEMSHVALTRKVFPPLERMIVLQALPVTAPPIGIIVSVAYIYCRYIGPAAGEDFASEYAKVAGWIINNTNPFSFLWHDTTKLPNAVTGWNLIGKTVGLRNIHRPTLAIPIPPLPDDEEQARKEAAYQAAGFASVYGATDLHEDWAESVKSLAIHAPVTMTSAFAPRRDFITLDAKVWPRDYPPITPGLTYGANAPTPAKPGPDMTGFRVDFGFFSGKPGKTLSIPLKMRRMSADDAGPEAAPGDPDDADAPSMGEGYGQPDQSMEDYAPAVKAQIAIAERLLDEADLQDTFDRAFSPTRDALAAVARDAPTGSFFELLQTAECRGDGLIRVSAKPVEHGIALSGIDGAAVGDILFGADGSMLAVAGVGENRTITSSVVLPSLVVDGDTPQLPDSLPAVEQFPLLWRPSREARNWDVAGSSAGFPDVNAALTGLITLWGSCAGGRDRDLGSAGNFVALAIARLELDTADLLDGDGAAVGSFLDGYGEGVREANDDAPLRVLPGDLVRLKPDELWGICYGASRDAATLDLLVQGGMTGLVGEEEGAVTLQMQVPSTSVSGVWHPSARARSG